MPLFGGQNLIDHQSDQFKGLKVMLVRKLQSLRVNKTNCNYNLDILRYNLLVFILEEREREREKSGSG